MTVDNNVASWTSDQLIADVRRKARLPRNSLDWTDTQVMREASDQIWGFAAWAQAQGSDGRLLTTFDRSVNSSLPSPYRNSGEYLLPPLAMGDTIYQVSWFTLDGVTEYPLKLVEVAQQAQHARSTDTGTPQGYALLADRVRVYPEPSASGYLRYTYQRRHPELCADNALNAPTISSFQDQGNGFTRIFISTSTPFAAGQYLDLVNTQYPYRTIIADLYLGDTAGTGCDVYIPYVYASSIPLVGMRLVRAGQLPYVQLPLEFRGALTWKIAGDILTQQGDMQAAQAAQGLAESALARALGMTTRRDKADRQKVINPYSLARRGVRRMMRTDRFP